MRAAKEILVIAAILATSASFTANRNTKDLTDVQEFAASHLSLIISPILSTTEIRQIEVHWSHSCLAAGDSIAVYTETPSKNVTPVYSFEPNASSGFVLTGIQANFVASSDLTFERQCLGYHAAWLRDGEIMRTNCLETRPNWMADRKSKLGSRKFRDIFIPGSHNSGSYSITKDPTTDNIITKYVICQDEDVLAQLIYGIRYLDIRVAYYPQTSAIWWINHGVIRIVELQSVINDVKKFLDNTDEIVIFDIQEFPVGFDTGLNVHKLLVNYLEEQFADYILPKIYGWSTTLDAIWNSGKRLIIGYDEKNVLPLYDTLWPCVTQQWGDVRSVSDLYNYLQTIENNGLSSSSTNPRSAMAELTPNTWDIILDRLGGLRQMAEDVNANVTTWYNTDFSSSANVVSVDFFRGSGIIETAIEWNDRRFSEVFTPIYTCSKK